MMDMAVEALDALVCDLTQQVQELTTLVEVLARAHLGHYETTTTDPHGNEAVRLALVPVLMRKMRSPREAGD